MSMAESDAGVRRRTRAIQRDFFENLAFALEAGLSLQEAVLNGVDPADAEIGPALDRIYKQVSLRLRQGLPFSVALRDSLPGMAGEHLAILVSGEKTGTVLRAVRLVLQHVREAMEDRRQLLSALMYPLLVIVVTVGGSLAFSLVLAAGWYGTRPDPVGARNLIAVNAAVVSLLLCLGLVVAVFARAEKGNAPWQLFCRRFTRNLPVPGRLLLFRELYLFCALGTHLCQAGLDFIEAFEQACAALPAASPLQAAGLDAVRLIRQGCPAAAALRSSALWPARVTHWIAMAERSGDASRAFELLSGYYRERYLAQRSLLSRLAEPAGIVLAGLCVALILAVFIQTLMAVSVFGLAF